MSVDYRTFLVRLVLASKSPLPDDYHTIVVVLVEKVGYGAFYAEILEIGAERL